MKELLFKSPWRKWFWIGLLMQLIAAWFSIGYHHPDEHFQILEFANYKLGFSTAADLPWEFGAQCRPAALPFIVYLLCKALLGLHLYNPFVVAFILRLLTGILSWWVSLRLVMLLRNSMQTDRGKDMYVWCSMLLWYVPYIGVRFSSENVAGLLLFLSLVILLQRNKLSFGKKNVLLLLAGLLLGFSVFIRLQMAFALVAVGVWLLFIAKYKWRELLLLIAGGLAAIALCLLCDYWFYGRFILTPLNYYTVNITNNAAANWGVFPWWYYVPQFVERAVIPISLVLLLLFANGLRHKPMHLMSLVCIAFITAHSMIGHKELRFLFPVNTAFIFVACTGFDKFIEKYGAKRWVWSTFKLLAVINIILLVFKIFTPAQEAFKYYQFIYQYGKNKDVKLLTLGSSPYHLNGVEVNFFKPQHLTVQVYQSMDSIVSAAKRDQENTLFLNKQLLPASVAGAYQLQQVYCIFPSVVLKYNINNWQERSNIWAVYKGK